MVIARVRLEQVASAQASGRKFWHEHLSLQWFRNRVDAAVSIEPWRRHYNEVRPHSSLAYQTPHEFKAIAKLTPKGPFSSNDWPEETRQVSTPLTYFAPTFLSSARPALRILAKPKLPSWQAYSKIGWVASSVMGIE